MIPKKMFNELLSRHIGGGTIHIKTQDNMILSIDFNTGKDGVLYRVGNGKTVFPIEVSQGDESFTIYAFAEEPRA